MLAARLLLLGNGRRAEEQDTRPVDEIFGAAAQRLDKPRQPAIASNLAANDIDWAWQLAELTDANWDVLGVPIGLQTAVRAELANPTKKTGAKAKDVAALDERKRRFLLMPDANGQPAKPLNEFAAYLLGLVATPVADRQNLTLALCELNALINGLLISALARWQWIGIQSQTHL